jgi:hypothetical protein
MSAVPPRARTGTSHARLGAAAEPGGGRAPFRARQRPEPGATTDPPPATTRTKAKKFAGTVAMLAVGALIATLVPRLLEAAFPKQTKIPDVVIVAHYSGHNSYTYFPEAPDWPALAARHAACAEEDSSKPIITQYTSRSDCEAEAFAAFGGVPEFGSASVSVTNGQTASIQITEVRSVVDKRTPTRFAAYYSPQSGGPIGTVLGFNLDQDTYRARLMDSAENVVPPLTPPPDSARPAYFDTQHLEIEPGRTENLFVAAMATYEGVVEWHLEIEYEAMNEDGRTQPMTARIRPPIGPFKGARSSATPPDVRSAL